VQQSRAGTERVELASKLISRRCGVGVVLECGEYSAELRDLAS